MAKAIYWQKGDKLDYKNETDVLIESGQIVAFGSRIGIAGMDIPVGGVGSLVVTGIWRMPKAAEDIAAGAEVYFSEADGNVSAAEADGSVLAGYAVAAAAAGDAVVLVHLP